jgi:basic amino acid/polyamine antiporter, APA family
VSRPERRSRLEPLLQRGVGVPGLFIAVYSTVGFSIYFALGVVADRGLGLTPLIFLAAGLLFALTTLTYAEGASMLRERGGSSSFARHGFNELVAFIAGWAILIDYLIIVAMAAISVPHYLEPITPDLSLQRREVGVAAMVIVAACLLNAFNVTGRGREKPLMLLALADVVLQLAVVVVGVLVVLQPERLTAELDLFSSPTLTDATYAAVVAMLAYAGIEAASDLAPDLDVRRRDLRRIISVGAVTVPLVYAGMAAIALMAVPVLAGPQGPETALGGEYVEAPILGVVSAYDPAWLSDAMRLVVAAIAAPVLFWATATAMLGVSRHIYTLAINRQIPSWLGKLNARHATPHVAIAISGAIALGLVVPVDVKLLAGIYAFGSTLAITIAHFSILRLRVTQPDRPRPFRVPWNVAWRGAQLPVPALFAALVSALAFLSVLVLHDTARWVGGSWMAFGLLFYFVYRRLVEGTSLTRRVSVTERALTKQVRGIEYANILVPVFGGALDDDIVSTAGRLAAAEQADGDVEGGKAKLALIYVVEVPLAVPLEAELPTEHEEDARRALQRARDVAEEYADVAVTTEIIRARKIGAGIVEAARRSGAEAIVIGGEPPTKIRGGATLGGIGAAKPAEIGAATEYVLKKAPCQVLLTAPPEDAQARPRAPSEP